MMSEDESSDLTSYVLSVIENWCDSDTKSTNIHIDESCSTVVRGKDGEFSPKEPGAILTQAGKELLFRKKILTKENYVNPYLTNLPATFKG